MLRSPFAFWLPAFVLLFLCWAWVDSTSHVSGVDLSFDTRSSLILVSVNHGNSVLHLKLDHTAGGGAPGDSYAANPWRVPMPAGYRYRWFPPPRFSARPGFLDVPHWLVILVYLMVWSFAITRRNRRPV
ncbi:hypothetical protein OJ996_25635 [Luteolibacter sp. GHJ8]|uniref:Uncharacterized protein n=1 Tax=Luteolibacter rhizosphaerae TaxID=2989719 RepID=A0ABT3GBH4_9BACT|nr:hypothetical protein [Luteolibacter rhizosphaerae]MCW1916997.1 hypothetical protein [Luteolibacter rhizosphaerae]